MPKAAVKAAYVSSSGNQLLFKASGYSSFGIVITDKPTQIRIKGAGGIKGTDNGRGLFFDKDYNGTGIEPFLVYIDKLYASPSSKRSSYPRALHAQFVGHAYHSQHRLGFGMYRSTFKVEVDGKKSSFAVDLPGARISQLEWQPTLHGHLDATGYATFAFNDYPQVEFSVRLGL